MVHCFIFCIFWTLRHLKNILKKERSFVLEWEWSNRNIVKWNILWKNTDYNSLVAQQQNRYISVYIYVYIGIYIYTRTEEQALLGHFLLAHPFDLKLQNQDTDGFLTIIFIPSTEASLSCKRFPYSSKTTHQITTDIWHLSSCLINFQLNSD